MVWRDVVERRAVRLRILEGNRSDFNVDQCSFRSLRYGCGQSSATSAQVGSMLLNRRWKSAGSNPQWWCASLIPGITTRPLKSMRFVCGPANIRTFSVVPMATMRSPRIASASTKGYAETLVKILPFSRIKSGGDCWPDDSADRRVKASRPSRILIFIRGMGTSPNRSHLAPHDRKQLVTRGIEPYCGCGNALVMTEPVNSQIVGNPYLGITSRLP